MRCEQKDTDPRNIVELCHFLIIKPKILDVFFNVELTNVESPQTLSEDIVDVFLHVFDFFSRKYR
jgi:hypothetical protein